MFSRATGNLDLGRPGPYSTSAGEDQAPFSLFCFRCFGRRELLHSRRGPCPRQLGGQHGEGRPLVLLVPLGQVSGYSPLQGGQGSEWVARQ